MQVGEQHTLVGPARRDGSPRHSSRPARPRPGSSARRRVLLVLLRPQPRTSSAAGGTGARPAAATHSRRSSPATTSSCSTSGSACPSSVPGRARSISSAVVSPSTQLVVRAAPRRSPPTAAAPSASCSASSCVQPTFRTRSCAVGIARRRRPGPLTAGLERVAERQVPPAARASRRSAGSGRATRAAGRAGPARRPRPGAVASERRRRGLPPLVAHVSRSWPHVVRRAAGPARRPRPGTPTRTNRLPLRIAVCAPSQPPATLHAPISSAEPPQRRALRDEDQQRAEVGGQVDDPRLAPRPAGTSSRAAPTNRKTRKLPVPGPKMPS